MFSYMERRTWCWNNVRRRYIHHYLASGFPWRGRFPSPCHVIAVEITRCVVVDWQINRSVMKLFKRTACRDLKDCETTLKQRQSQFALRSRIRHLKRYRIQPPETGSAQDPNGNTRISATKYVESHASIGRHRQFQSG